MDNSWMKKFIAAAVSLCLIGNCSDFRPFLVTGAAECTVSAGCGEYYSNSDEEFLKYAEEILDTDLDITDDEDCTAGGSSQAMYGNFGTGSVSALNTNEKTIYKALKSELSKVSDGRTADAVFTVNGFSTSGTTANYAFTKNISHQKIIDYLLADMPYELYWFDKTVGYKVSWAASNSGGVYTVSSATFSFTVSKDYSASGTTGTTVADTGKTGAVTQTAVNALAVVNQNSGKSDYDKLVAYRDYICSQVDYNHAAVNNNYAYGDPWQIIYAFDNDPSTDIVCEGYSKAFQYLCELSSFSGEVICRSVTGSMGGPHMWNVVTIGGKNYLVDVTNCDSGSIGYPDALFLKGMSGSVSGGYSKTIYSKKISYTYDSSMSGMYGTAALTLSSVDYGVESSPEQNNSNQPSEPQQPAASPNISQNVSGNPAKEITKADGSLSMTGIGTVEGWVDTDVMKVVLPTQSLDFIVDPQGVIKKSNAKRYQENAVFEYHGKEDGFVFFKTLQSDNTLKYSSDLYLSVYNKSSYPVQISATAEFSEPTGTVMIDQDGVYESNDRDNSVSFSITDIDSRQKSYIRSSTTGAVLDSAVLNGVPDAYSFKYTGKGYDYSLDESKLQSRGNPYGMNVPEYTIMINGTCNSNADWTGMSLKGAKLSVVWRVSRAS